MTRSLGLTASPETRGSHTARQPTLGLAPGAPQKRGSAEATRSQLKSALLPELPGAQGTPQYQKGMAEKAGFNPLIICF